MIDNQSDITKLGYHLNHAFNALVVELNRALQSAGLPLNHSQFSVIQALWRSEDKVMSQRQIAVELGKDPAAISRTLNYLESQGFVARTQVSGCKNSVILTPEAISLRPKIENVIAETVAKACKDVSPDEYCVAISFLKKIYDTLR